MDDNTHSPVADGEILTNPNAGRDGHGEYILVNAYEDTVRSAVKEMMDKTDMCHCDKCFLDVCAIVFNKRYSRFVTTRAGELLTNVPNMTHGNRVEMTVVVMDAINTVKSSPQH